MYKNKHLHNLMQSNLIDLYTNNLFINGYSITDIINLNDSEFKNITKYLQWFFPSVNTITDNDRIILTTNKHIKTLIKQLLYRILNYHLITKDTRLYTRIIDFLKYIHMSKIIKSMDRMGEDRMGEDRMSSSSLQSSSLQSSSLQSSSLQSSPAISFRGLYNVRNSCYIDSVLVALFASPNKIIHKNILKKNLLNPDKQWITCNDTDSRNKIQYELLRITHSFMGGEYIRDCTSLRKSLQSCTGSQDFHKGGMQDAGEFLLYLFNIFKVSLMTKQRTTYVTNSLATPPNPYIKTSSETQDSTPLLNIPGIKIQKGLDIVSFLNETDDALFSKEDFYRHEETGIRYRRRIENILVLHADYIVFNVERITYETEEFIDVKIQVPEEIILQDSTHLHLNAVVIYVSRHYTCYFKLHNSWYYYDDLDNSVTFVGNYLDLLQSRPKIERNGTLLFYTR